MRHRKFGDDSRGVLLQQVLDEVVQRSEGSQVVFASALSENPEVLLEGSPAGVRCEYARRTNGHGDTEPSLGEPSPTKADPVGYRDR